MEGKICSKCREFKSYSDFKKDKAYKDGYTGQCKQCIKEYQKQYRDSHKEERKQYYNSHKEELNEKSKQYRDSHKEEIKDYNKQYRDSHKEERKQYYNSHKEELNEKSKQYYNSHKEEFKEYRKQYHQDIKDKNISKITEIIKNIEKYNLINKHNTPIYGYIYKIENIKTGRIYIGQTITPITYRYKSNIIEAWKNERLKYDNQKFKDELINIDDFKLTEILDVGICKYHLDKLEAYYINLYDSYNNGYNNKNGNHITDDGIGEFKEILEYYNINESELIWRD